MDFKELKHQYSEEMFFCEIVIEMIKPSTFRVMCCERRTDGICWLSAHSVENRIDTGFEYLEYLTIELLHLPKTYIPAVASALWEGNQPWRKADDIYAYLKKTAIRKMFKQQRDSILLLPQELILEEKPSEVLLPDEIVECREAQKEFALKTKAILQPKYHMIPELLALGYSPNEVADMLEVHRGTIYRKMKKILPPS